METPAEMDVEEAPVDICRCGALVGASPRMKEVFDLIDKAARLDVMVLIVGETGTGKELVAREIHARGRRKDCPFVAVNMGALSPELVASELFGHVKGSFTGAVENQAGRFAEADGGTLFLDEIATMEERAQIALLRVLESGAIRPIGAKNDRKVDVRLMAATNADLRKAVDMGLFREDLLQRLQVLGIVVPPLRQHIQDLPMLVRHFLDIMRDEFDLNVDDAASETIEVLERYPWPGNIRELRNVLAEAVVKAERGTLYSEHLPPRITAGSAPAIAPATRPASLANPPFLPLERQAPASSETPDGDGIFIPMGVPLDEVQKKYVAKTLRDCANNKTHAARVLGVSRKALYDKLLRWGLRPAAQLKDAN